MNISGVNCTPLKPAFASNSNEDSKYRDVLTATDKLEDSLVLSSDIKSPIQTVAAVGLATVVAFVSGRKIGSLISTFAKNAPTQLENTLKKGADFVKTKAEGLKIDNPANIAEKLKNKTGKLLVSAEKTGRNAYRKFANLGLKEGALRADNAFKNLAGVATVASVIPPVCKRDTNGDGVADIAQFKKNVYTGTKSKCGDMVNSASKIAEAISILTQE